MIPAPETAPSATPHRRRWHLVYYVLAAFDLLTIATTLFLTHHIVESYREAITVNRRWMSVLDESAQLAKLAGDVNAPGNDVFDTHDVNDESSRLEKAHTRFVSAVEAARQPLLEHHDASLDKHDVRRLLRDLDALQAAELNMVDEAHLIFAQFRAGRADLAGTRMATMDRRYAAVHAALADFNADVRMIQDAVFDEEQALAARLQRFEWIIAVLIVFIVTGVMMYGRRIAREMERAAQDRVRHEAESQRHTAELATARDAALSASRAKSAFLQTMSHELRTPLNGVLGMNALLLDTTLDDDQREYARTVQDCGASLLGLLDDVLEYSKAEGGRMHGEIIDFDPQSMAEEIIDALASDAQTKGLTIGVHVAPQLPTTVGGDPQRLRQVLGHLVSNAIKFSDSGDVELRIEGVEDLGSMVTVRFEVSDTGPGIPAEAQPRLFEPFTQADSSTTRRHGGTGMGLAVAQRLARLMGGRIEFESEPGHGARFWFSIPLEVRAASRPLDPEAPGKRVLCVAAEPRVRERLRRQVLAWGYDTDVAVDSRAACAALESGVRDHRPFDVVVLAVGEGAGNAANQFRAVRSPHSIAVLWAAPAKLPSDASLATTLCDLVLTSPLRSSLLRESLAVLATPPEDRARRASSQPRRLRVLIAEEHPMNQRLLQLQLQRLGHAVQLVPDGEAALQEFSRGEFDLVLLDAHMVEPECDTAARALRHAPVAWARRAPIVAMTAWLEQGDHERFVEAGMNDHLPKPVTLERLRDLLERWTPDAAPSHDVAA